MAIAQSIIQTEIAIIDESLDELTVQEIVVYHIENITGEPICMDYMISKKIEFPSHYLGDHVIHLMNQTYFGKNKKIAEGLYREACNYCPEATNW